jgi:hypothetical protein
VNTSLLIGDFPLDWVTVTLIAYKEAGGRSTDVHRRHTSAGEICESVDRFSLKAAAPYCDSRGL